MERLKTPSVSISNVNVNERLKNYFLQYILPLKIFSSTIVNADIESWKSLHTLFDKYIMDHVLVKFEPNSMVWNEQDFELVDKEQKF